MGYVGSCMVGVREEGWREGVSMRKLTAERLRGGASRGPLMPSIAGPARAARAAPEWLLPLFLNRVSVGMKNKK